LVIPENATTWEFTPYEFGSWAFGSVTKVRGAFTPIEYLGTRMDNGNVNGSCYKGFDQMRYVLLIEVMSNADLQLRLGNIVYAIQWSSAAAPECRG